MNNTTAKAGLTCFLGHKADRIPLEKIAIFVKTLKTMAKCKETSTTFQRTHANMLPL